MGSAEVCVDLDDGEVGGLVGSDHARRPAEVLGVGIGGQLDVDFVGLVDDVVVGDDVALGIDDEAGSQRLTHLAAVIFALVGHLPAEEAVEEVLESLLPLSRLSGVAAALVILVVFISGRILRIGRGPAVELASRPGCRLLGQRLGIDVHDRRAHLLGDLREDALELVGRKVGVGNLQRSGISGAVLLLLPTHSVGHEGPAHNSD